ncbi:tRNA uridine(34) 5-carboxymethylaminomethyl modification radical SAM/GNAT enzyme Elp3 [Candidatus Woesearchaeota archaeon]|nr:tRNA uridine(34) 5-carboxymethylaminomethyl modification radical SAM/GNAT enzyme Elp3 [Candidatus Woesearchaeota archaeon]|tara:strand:- start:24169 stop:25851 length:1683 start_codon:yes stop_codon:yes gene_type:complete
MKNQFYAEVIEAIKKEKSDDFTKLKTKLSKKYGMSKIPSNIEIFLNSSEEDLKNLKLVTKPTRTLSGVATISVMTKPAGCPHGKCTFCPGGPDSIFGNVPQSYTGKEPATMRAIRNNFDAYLQVFSRLEQYAVLGQAFDKVELIIQGGTFPSMDAKYQNKFIADAYKAMNDFSAEFFVDEEIDLPKFKEFFELPGDFKNEERTRNVKEKILKLKGKNKIELLQEQKRNETAKIKCVGLTVETKPDWAFLEHGNQMLELGCTRVELGIQSVYEAPLKLTNRGHSIADTIKSIQILKDLGLKINAHYMLGLPGVDRDKEVEGLKQLFSDPNFKPDMLKIYPLLVMKGTPLYLQWKRGQYKPITTAEAAEIISEAKRFFPKWVRVMRVNRDIPTYVTSAGIDKTNLRQYVKELQEKKNIVCNCIRCREVGRNKTFENVEITIDEFEASNGKEFFIEAEDVKNNVLLGFCRLRFPSQQLRKEITDNTAMIRELHVYASSVAVGNLPKEKQVQHRGYGKKLMMKAEEIAKEHGKDKMLVISGIGAKEYYKKLGYDYDGVYMGKKL